MEVGKNPPKLIPLRSPPIEVGDVEQAGRGHYRVSRRMVAMGKGPDLTSPVFVRPTTETFSRSFCWDYEPTARRIAWTFATTSVIHAA